MLFRARASQRWLSRSRKSRIDRRRDALGCDCSLSSSEAACKAESPTFRAIFCPTVVERRTAARVHKNSSLLRLNDAVISVLITVTRRYGILQQLGTVKLSRWRHWLNFIKTNGAAPRAAKSALQRSRLNWQLHQLWKSFELHKRSKLDELARAVMIGRVLIAVFYHFLISVFSLFHWELCTTLNAHSTLAYSELHRGRHLFPSTSNFKFAAFLSEWTINCLFSLTDARTLSQVLS